MVFCFVILWHCQTLVLLLFLMFTCKLLMSVFLPLLSETSASEGLIIKSVQGILRLKLFVLESWPKTLHHWCHYTPLELRRSPRHEENCRPWLQFSNIISGTRDSIFSGSNWQKIKTFKMTSRARVERPNTADEQFCFLFGEAAGPPLSVGVGEVERFSFQFTENTSTSVSRT